MQISRRSFLLRPQNSGTPAVVLLFSRISYLFFFSNLQDEFSIVDGTTNYYCLSNNIDYKYIYILIMRAGRLTEALMWPSPAAANSWRRPSVNTLSACLDALYILLPGLTEYECPVMLKLSCKKLKKKQNKKTTI